MKSKKQYLGTKNSKWICVILFFIMLVIYALDNSSLTNIISWEAFTYIIKPVIWLGISIGIIFLLPKAEHKADKKLRNFLNWWAAGFALIMIVISFFAGIFEGFGWSPYSHTVQGLAQNLALIGSMLIARELIRNYIINSLTEKENYLLFSLLALFMTIISFPIKKYTAVSSFQGAVIFIGQYFAPEFFKNLFATYLVFLGGSVSSMIYMGLLQGIQGLSPILPDLRWVITAFIEILCPIFSLLAIENIYLRKIGALEEEKEDKYDILKWAATAVFSIGIVWFSVGIFPVYPSVVATGSMSPAIKAGDIVLINKNEKDSLKSGDVMQFRDGSILVSHRIVEVIDKSGEKYFKTKGDNNPVEDSQLTNFKDVKGKIVATIPKVGLPIVFLRSR